MNSNELKQSVCRICLDENVFLNWNTKFFEYMTYRECYYKYTQLEDFGFDSFSPMLCQVCANSLHNLHSLILKALQSYKYFQETQLISSQLVDDANSQEDDIKYMPTEFETVLVEKTDDIEPVLGAGETPKNSDQEKFFIEPLNSDGEFNIEEDDSDENLDIKSLKTKATRKYSRRSTKAAASRSKKQRICKNKEEKDKVNRKLSQTLKDSSAKSKRNPTAKVKAKKTVVKDEDLSDEVNVIDKNIGKQGEEKEIIGPLDDNNDHEEEEQEQQPKKVTKYTERRRMCSICSKILKDKTAVRRHEQTHIENRERNETCNICGLKFFDKMNLKAHEKTHNQNREKHKCDFCEKEFYNKGALNIHRRIHLGQMVPCTLCSKEFFRQIDLKRHMNTHSATAINSETEKRSRYFVRCPHCDKTLLSTTYKSHVAAHLNDPLMGCNICNEKFFSRKSCVRHMKKVHLKLNDYNDFIIKYPKERLSNLFFEQKLDIQFTND